MKQLLIASILAIGTASVAYGQEPAAKPDPGAEHPPTNRMDQAVPTMKAPDGQVEHAPTNRMDKAVPPMKATDAQSTDTGTKAGAFVASEQWIGRPVYSSDGKQLGKVDSLTKDSAQKGFYMDMGGFLGLGETRALITSDQIQDVKDDRIVLTLTEAGAKELPAAQ